MTTINLQQIQKAESLTNAFRIFNELSENLANSYHGLEEQVAKLNGELAAVRSERVSTLVEKEKLASRLQQILAALPAAVIIVNTLGQVIDCNIHAIDYLGEPLLSQDWQTVKARSLQAVAGSPREHQLIDGRRVNITRNLLSNDAEQIILLSDVSELRSLQDLLAQQKHLTAMGEMVASLAHQVRTPLATALLYASQLSNPNVIPEKRQLFSQKILERLHYLERQVNDMLIFAKQGRLAMQCFSLQELLRQVAESMESYTGVFKIDNNVKADQLLGNQDALFGALMNLLNNAVEAGAKHIQFSLQQMDAERMKLIIFDDGPGIELHQKDRLFEPFYTTKTHGTGLGLAVVDSVLRAHNGSINCCSEPGAGCTFIIILPCINHYTLGLSAISTNQEMCHEAL
ncbi:ATP-binding protein [Methylomonas sp. AM2-LC]|uniref:sensor histidine kinase n=1 Tax=Methylomonas sp. AM2-LC TaxID=3153301 RepID=UPI0032661E58